MLAVFLLQKRALPSWLTSGSTWAGSTKIIVLREKQEAIDRPLKLVCKCVGAPFNRVMAKAPLTDIQSATPVLPSIPCLNIEISGTKRIISIARLLKPG